MERTTKEQMLEIVSELQELQRSTIANANTKWYIELLTKCYPEDGVISVVFTLFDQTEQVIKDSIPDSDDVYHFYTCHIYSFYSVEQCIAGLNKVKELINEIDNYEY